MSADRHFGLSRKRRERFFPAWVSVPLTLAVIIMVVGIVLQIIMLIGRP